MEENHGHEGSERGGRRVQKGIVNTMNEDAKEVEERMGGGGVGCDWSIAMGKCREWEGKGEEEGRTRCERLYYREE